MTKKIFIAILLIVSVVGGCKKEITSQEVIKSKIAFDQIENHIVSIELAKKVAILHSIYPDQLKRLGKNKNPLNTTASASEVQKQTPEKSIKSIVGLKFTENEPSCYVISYNQGGFVIVSGDDRMIPILAYSDTGVFSEPEKYNPGLKIWMTANVEYISALRTGKLKEQKLVAAAWKELEQKSLLTLGKNAVLLSEPPCGEENEYETYQRDWAELLFTVPWGQGNPYNVGIPMESCGRPYVGCVALAVSIVMKHHEYPTNFGWSSMPSTGATAWTQTLIYSNHVATNTTPSCINSLATYTNSDSALGFWGYHTDGFSSYDYETVKSDILNGRPVILRAESYGYGHQWVADGVQEIEIFTCTPREDYEGSSMASRNPPVPTHDWILTNTYAYLSMNWGWNGDDNAWYNAFVWSPLTYGYTFNSSMKMLTGIYP